MNKTLIFAAGALTLVAATLFILSSKGMKLDLQSSQNYTFYAFELEWPGAVCQTKNCNQSNMGSFDGKNFNIHGLWPSGSAQDSCYYPDTCTNQQLDFNSIDKTTLAYMDKYWNSLYKNTEDFIEHEWTKHGTCFSGDVTTFFKTAVANHQRYNPVRALAQNNIVPSNDQGYSASEMQAALENNLGGPVKMKCQKSKGQQLFIAVDLYLDLNYNLIENPCPKREYICRDDSPVYFPSF